MDSIIEQDFSKMQNFTDCFASEINENKIRYMCKFVDCGLTYCDKSGAIRHLKQGHKNVYECIKGNKNTKQNKNGSIFDSIELRVKVDPNEIVDACVNLITINSLPISFVDTAAFKKILEPYQIALDKKGIKLKINRRNILTHIAKKASAMKKYIKSEVKKKFLCLMIDIATRYNKSILGVNIAYMEDSNTIIRTIGMHRLKKSHTAENIRDVIRNNLLDYDISLSQIFSITSDNGANMLKAIALLDDHLQKEKNSTDNDRENHENENNDTDSDEEIESNIFDANFYNDLLAGVRLEFNSLIYSDLIQGISCAAHCLHLIVTKAIEKSKDALKVLEKCRELCKKLRRPTFQNLLESLSYKQAKLDINTRWNSIYLMVFTVIF